MKILDFSLKIKGSCKQYIEDNMTTKDRISLSNSCYDDELIYLIDLSTIKNLFLLKITSSDDKF